jgi:uncharacterized protein (TIGR00369 family)
MTKEEAEALLATCELHAFVGLQLVEFEEGHVRFRFAPPATARATGGAAIHGGAIATALDTAATFAVISSVGVDASTVDLRVDYLRPAVDAELTVEGVTLRAGRRLAWADATAATPEGRIVATARGTFTWRTAGGGASSFTPPTDESRRSSAS